MESGDEYIEFYSNLLLINMDSDLFSLLGVTPDCSEKELKKAYK